MILLYTRTQHCLRFDGSVFRWCFDFDASYKGCIMQNCIVIATCFKIKISKKKQFQRICWIVNALYYVIRTCVIQIYVTKAWDVLSIVGSTFIWITTFFWLYVNYNSSPNLHTSLGRRGLYIVGTCGYIII